MFFSRYEYRPIYIILHNFLRCRENMSEDSFQELLIEEDYDGLKKILDVEEVSKLAIQAIETYLMKTATIDFSRLLYDHMGDNLDYFMDLGLVVGNNYYVRDEFLESLLDVICYFHNEYIYHNANLKFKYVNKNVLYEDLSQEERDNELFVLNPILAAIGSMYSVGKTNYSTKGFDLKEELVSKIEDHIKTLSKESRDEVYYENSYEYKESMGEDEAKEYGFVYQVKNNEITIVDYAGKDETLIIPKTINEIPVRYIDGLKFLNFKKLVVLAELKEIKNNSVVSCYSLKEIEVYGSLGIVGQGVFSGCKVPSVTWRGVTYLTINKNIAYLAMRYEDFIDTVYIERKCKSIRGGAFFGTNIKSLSAPSVEYIGEKAFGQCKKLQTVQLNRWLKGIGEYAFYLCESLMNVKIDARVLPPYLFYKCSSLRNISIGEGVEELGLYSISSCESLKRLTIPASVHKIGELFIEYTPLEELEFKGNYYWLGKNDEGKDVTFTPEMLSDFANNVRLFKKHDDYNFEVDLKTSIVENMTMKEAEEYGFVVSESYDDCYCIDDWTKDEKVLVIPKTIDNIPINSLGGFFGNNFSNKKNLERIIILGTFSSVTPELFSNCPNLKEITIPSDFEYIASSFQNCPLVTKVESGVTYIRINNDPYYYASEVDKTQSTIHFNLNTKILAPSLFYGNETIRECYLPDVRLLPNCLFYKAKNLQGIMIPDTVEELDGDVFAHCLSLKQVIFLGEKLLKIGNGCFERCINLTNIHIPRGVTVIDKCTFESCLNLKEVTLPTTVSKVRYHAFYNCLSLKRIEFDRSLWIATRDETDKLYFSGDYYIDPESCATDFVSLFKYEMVRYEGDLEEFKELEEEYRIRKKLKVKIGQMDVESKKEKLALGTFDYYE